RPEQVEQREGGGLPIASGQRPRCLAGVVREPFRELCPCRRREVRRVATVQPAGAAAVSAELGKKRAECLAAAMLDGGTGSPLQPPALRLKTEAQVGVL